MKNRKTLKVVSSFMSAFILFSVFSLTSCGKKDDVSKTEDTPAKQEEAAKTENPPAKQEKVILSFTLGDPTDTKFFKEKTADFTKKFENITVDIQGYADTDPMKKNLKIQQAANELPDLIQLKPDFMNDFKNSLLVWGDEEVVKRNKFASQFAIDGKVYGLPLRCFSEFVFYNKSIFSELNLEIPNTWDKFIEVAQAIKKSGKYIPVAFGGKDAWFDYPFNEFMPHTVSKDPYILSNIAKQDEPFGKDSGFYKAYGMIDKLFKADVFGEKPLGVGADQAKQLFESKKAAMICLGQWYLSQYMEKVNNTDELGVFPMPIVNDPGEKNRIMTMADNFMVINKSSKYTNEAKEFVNWCFSKEIYPEYLKVTMNNSTISDVTSDLAIFKDFYSSYQFDEFLYFPGDENYKKLSDETKFDVKAIGQRMLSGESYDKLLNDMNKKWKSARTKLGIK